MFSFCSSQIIETKMEQFKICEKDTKTKAYSKEGLARETRSDPKEVEREEKKGWINDWLERLHDLMDSLQVEIEKITATTRGKSKSKEQARCVASIVLTFVKALVVVV